MSLTAASSAISTNHKLAQKVIEEATKKGVREFYLCPGARLAPLLHVLKNQDQLTTAYGFEERSTAFYALGRARQTSSPVAIVTTSGTAVGELFPAAMEAYYMGVPLLLISADRPRRFRGTAAPQAAEQVGLFGMYTPNSWDLADDDSFSLVDWSLHAPAHVNVCFEEPLADKNGAVVPPLKLPTLTIPSPILPSTDHLDQFLAKAKCPWAIVGGLPPESHESVVSFLLKLQAPVYLEATSGLREDPRLAPLQVRCIENVWERSRQAAYPIDAVLRLGHVPTLRPWRDLEDKQHELSVLSIHDLPFSGLSWSEHIQTPIAPFLDSCIPPQFAKHTQWVSDDQQAYHQLLSLMQEEPLAEPTLFHQLSLEIAREAHIYLGNSLPIREWDLAATHTSNHFRMTASRGLNGIDGQISQFLGLSNRQQRNYAILGDLTTLYDMAGPWVLESQQELPVTIIVINNGGGQIFSRMFKEKEFLNQHQMAFEPLAQLWGFSYDRWQGGTLPIPSQQHQLIEVTPDPSATQRFWDNLQKMRKS